MPRARITPSELGEMLNDRQMTYAEIAAEVGLTVSGVQQAVQRYGLVKPVLSHKKAIPWTIRDESHRSSKASKYLRDLSTIAQGGDVPQWNANTAFAWAQELVDAEMDIDYDEDMEPTEGYVSGGFFTRPALKSKWHIKAVLARAKKGYKPSERRT